MSLIKIEHLTFSYYGYSNDIFNDVSFHFDTNWKTGLIGRNGIGKTTLFKLLLGEKQYTGTIHKSTDCTKFPPSIGDASKNAMELFFELNPHGEEWRLFRELNLLGINEEVLYRPFETLSKGEQVKILLAMLFADDNEFLLIDEPTNHLDRKGRQIVSKYLKNKKGFLLISHDREFLDNCVDHIISLNRHSIDVQAGNFTSWYENKEKREQFEGTLNDFIEAQQSDETLCKVIRRTRQKIRRYRGDKNH